MAQNSKTVLWLVGLLVFAAIATGVVALLSSESSPPVQNELPTRFDYDLSRYDKIDPALVAYEQTARWPLDLKTARAIAVGPDDTVTVVGDQALLVLSPQGKLLDTMELGGAARCLAVDADGKRYIGFGDHVAVYRSDGAQQSAWQPLASGSLLTSIALDEQNVYVADAGKKRVVRYDRDGNFQNELAVPNERHDIPLLVIPSPYFDVAMGTDGLLRVVNPGKHLIEFFTPEGLYEEPLTWGKPGLQTDRFCGCCNPVAIALLADNRVVTAEKGIPRVKVYSPEGRFECVVATPEQLTATDAMLEETRTEHKLLAVDLATDSQGRILVLDPAAQCVRVYVQKDTGEHSKNRIGVPGP